MIGKVNASVMSNSLLSLSGGQKGQSSANSVNSSVVNKTNAQLAPFASLFINYDINFNKAVLQMRDSSTGEVQRQFPSEITMRARATQAELEAQSIKQSFTPKGENADFKEFNVQKSESGKEQSIVSTTEASKKPNVGTSLSPPSSLYTKSSFSVLA